MNTINIALDRNLVDELRCTAEQEGVELEVLVRGLWQQYQTKVQQEKIRAETRAFQAMHSELLATFRGQYVAVHGGQVVDHDPDQLTLYRRVRSRYGKTAVLITPVTDEPVETLSLVSFRMESNTR